MGLASVVWIAIVVKIVVVTRHIAAGPMRIAGFAHAVGEKWASRFAAILGISIQIKMILCAAEREARLMRAYVYECTMSANQTRNSTPKSARVNRTEKRASKSARAAIHA